MINVLVTGANGQLAKTIRELYSKNSDSIKFSFLSKSQLDISNLNEIESVFKKTNFDYCINCAAYTNVENAEDNPEISFKINAESVKNLALACKENNTTLIHISTDYVFDGTSKNTYLEEDKTNPINEYGRSKLLGEHYISDTLNNFFIIRTSWLYSKFGKNFARTILKKVQENTDLKITTSQIGTPSSCNDLAKFIYHLIKTREINYGIYHYSALGHCTWFDFAIQIAKHVEEYDINRIIPVNNFKSKAERPNFSVLNNSKAHRIFPREINWKSSVDEIIENLIKEN